jgi:hypothetical protein
MLKLQKHPNHRPKIPFVHDRKGPKRLKQNWQSEFLSIGLMVVLSIFLRQKGSPESKPVDAAHSETGTA